MKKAKITLKSFLIRHEKAERTYFYEKEIQIQKLIRL